MVSRWRRGRGNERGLPRAGQDAVRSTSATSHPAASGDTCCSGAAERSLLLLYALSGCLDEEALDFEAHLLECEACFQDLKTLDRAGVLVREALAADPAVLTRLRSALTGFRTSLGVSKAPPQRLA